MPPESEADAFIITVSTFLGFTGDELTDIVGGIISPTLTVTISCAVLLAASYAMALS